MALTEQTIINSITTLPEQNCIQVQWANQVLRDNEVVSQQYHRKAYTQGQRAEFEAEVEGAANYVHLIDWVSPEIIGGV